MKSNWKIALAALVAVVLGCSSASAQFRFGVKAGVNLNSLHFSNLKSNLDKDNGCGFTGGVMTEFQVPVIGLCLDASLMYSRMNASTGIFNTDEHGIITETIEPNKGCLETFKLGGDDDVFKTKTFQTAWNIGVGVELFNHLQVAGSYGFGMNNIMKEVAGINTTNDFKVKNNYWTITAAYLSG